MKRNADLCFYHLLWQRPFEIESVYAVLNAIAALVPRGPVVLEVRGNKDGIRYLLAADRQYIRRVQDVFKAHGDVRFSPVGENGRAPALAAKQLKISRPVLSLKTDTTLSTIRAGLAAITNLPTDAEAVLQIILGYTIKPTPAPRNTLQDPHASWFQVVTGNVGPASAETLATVRDKAAQNGFAACVRIGLCKDAAPMHFYNILSALLTLESAGVHISMVNEKAEAVNTAYAPWHFPLSLSVKELANFLLLPVSDTFFPGVAGLHPKQTLPPTWYKNPAPSQDHSFAVSAALPDTRLSISPADSLLATHILGPIGAGKSTVLLNQIMAAIKAGQGVCVIDPKNDLVHSILERMPEERDKDVVIIDPSDPCPVGFNPFAFKEYGDPNLIADAVLAVFKEVFSENWGIRSQDVFSVALLTLAHTEGASLLWLPALLTNADFRKKITAGLKDKIGLEPYWEAFDEMNDSRQQAEILPTMNKIRQVLLRPYLRNVVGQAKPKLSLTDLFNQKKIVLVPLNKGVIGSESASLLGSMIVSLVWTLALSRASIPQGNRNIVSIFIDELQDYLKLPTSLSDALTQARGMSVALTVAHQHRAQLTPDVRSALDSNAHNKIVFGLNSAEDAKAMAAMAPDELDAKDFMSLPRYSIYTRFQSGKNNTGWVLGQTLPPPPATRDVVDLRATSMARYGVPAETVEAEYLKIIEAARNTPSTEDEKYNTTTFGKRRLP